MSIMKSMNTGLSGLNANGKAMSLIGDNIANVNTTGFKAGRMNFSDVIGNTMLGIGDGVGPGSVQQLFDQGALESTGQVTDMAIADRPCGFSTSKRKVSVPSGFSSAHINASDSQAGTRCSSAYGGVATSGSTLASANRSATSIR